MLEIFVRLGGGALEAARKAAASDHDLPDAATGGGRLAHADRGRSDIPYPVRARPGGVYGGASGRGRYGGGRRFDDGVN